MSVRLLVPISLLLLCAGCVAGGGAGTLQTGTLQGVKAGETADVSVVRSTAAAILRRCEDPASAQRFLDFLCSPEGQQQFTSRGWIGLE